MNQVDDVREFLSSRRARLTPEQAGLPAYGGHRRVKGLRREEVALLAGVSVDYYVRLERGNLSGASDSVLESLARALQLDDIEREYLYDLAHQSPTPGPRTRAASPKPRPVIQQVLDAITDAPAWVRNNRHDFLATNRMARALHAPMLERQPHPANSARFIYLDPAARDFFREWERVAEDVAGFLRQEAAHTPHDKALQELIGELSTQSPGRRSSTTHSSVTSTSTSSPPSSAPNRASSSWCTRPPRAVRAPTPWHCSAASLPASTSARPRSSRLSASRRQEKGRHKGSGALVLLASSRAMVAICHVM